MSPVEAFALLNDQQLIAILLRLSGEKGPKAAVLGTPEELAKQVVKQALPFTHRPQLR